MFDKVDLYIPLKDAFVNYLSTPDPEAERSGYVDPALYDFQLVELKRRVNGEIVSEPIKSQTWDSISTGLSGIAVGFYPEGNGFDKWPHVRIKCSPAKILQGHNVFGSENPKQGIIQMLATLEQQFPLIYAHLDLNNTHVRYLDCTYSAQIASFFRHRVYQVFGKLARSNQKVSRNDDYLQLGRGSEYVRQKIYAKFQELLADLKDAKRKRDHHRVAALSDPRIQDWSLDLMRFEATIGYRKLINLGIPTQLNEFLKFNDWFHLTHQQTLCHYLWKIAFKPLFDQIEGHTMKSQNDDEIRTEIDKEYITVSESGRINKRRANAVYQTYRAIKCEGYDTLASERNKTFFRNVKLMEEIGISRAFLKSIGPDSDEMVIPLINVINIDFSNQRPVWWEEPQAGFDNKARFTKNNQQILKLVS